MPGTYLTLRAGVIRTIRSFFMGREYLEVDTPLRLPSLIPEAHIEPEESAGWFLQTSPELCMKRLLAAGHPRIFQICKCFRRHERGSRHLPEFTMLEWYRTGIDYRDLMAECRDMLRYLAKETRADCPAARILATKSEWDYITVSEAFSRHAAISASRAVEEGSFDEILVRDIEPHLGRQRPAFLHDYPAALGSLARLKQDDPRVAERFELYVNGVELANGFSELTDAGEQRRRFEEERRRITKQGRDPGPMPERFLADLAQLDRAAGIALGLDRLVLLLSGAERIDEVVSFAPEAL